MAHTLDTMVRMARVKGGVAFHDLPTASSHSRTRIIDTGEITRIVKIAPAKTDQIIPIVIIVRTRHRTAGKGSPKNRFRS
jgi:hypothetical protein